MKRMMQEQLSSLIVQQVYSLYICSLMFSNSNAKFKLFICIQYIGWPFTFEISGTFHRVETRGSLGNGQV